MALRLLTQNDDALGIGQTGDERDTGREQILLLRDDIKRRAARGRRSSRHGRLRTARMAYIMLSMPSSSRLEAEILAELRPSGDDQRLALVRDGLPDFLRDKRHERVHQAQDLVEHIQQHLLGRALLSLVLAIEAGLVSSIYQSQ